MMGASTRPGRGGGACFSPPQLASPSPLALFVQAEDDHVDGVVRNPSVQHLLVWLNLRLQNYPEDCPKYVVSLTTDFRDSIKLACLLHAIGGDSLKGVIELVKIPLSLIFRPPLHTPSDPHPQLLSLTCLRHPDLSPFPSEVHSEWPISTHTAVCNQTP